MPSQVITYSTNYSKVQYSTVQYNPSDKSFPIIYIDLLLNAVFVLFLLDRSFFITAFISSNSLILIPILIIWIIMDHNFLY